MKELNPVRDLSYPPIFQVIFNMINVPEFQQDWDDLAVDVQIPLEIGAKVDFTLYLEATADGMRLDLVYNSDLFTPARMDTLLTQYCSLIEQVISLPTNPISSLSLLTPATVLLLPDPTAPLSSHWEGAVQTLFTQQAIKNPTKIAIEEDTNRWSYHDLDARSNQLAHFLGDQGIALGDVVAIYASRSASLVWAILGTLKAGATYTILDPAYPSVRLSEYLEQAQPHGLILLDEAGILPKAIRDQVAQIPLCCQITLPRSYEGQNNMFLSEYPTTPTTIGVGPDDLASITFTSGSTGRPKGILQRHGPLTHFLPWQQVTFDLSKEDRYTLLSGLSHDPLQRDIFTPLCLGATICIPSQSEMGMPGWLPQWMERTDITVTNLTPAMVQLVTQPLGNKTATMMPLLRYAFIVGDALRRHDVVRLWELAPNVTAVNMYGSTETQRAVSYYSIPHSHTANQSPVKEIIPLGQGAQDVQLLICTSTNQLAGVGEIGEILIRSPHLAQGYLNNSDLTRERFIANPFRQNPEDGCYRTGDLGRYLPNGHVEYLARSDQQVKIRGFRIELGEIEAALKELDIVRDAIVVIHEDERLDKRLIAYVVPLFEIVASDIIARLRQHLQNKLPIYMVPATFVVLAEIPLTPNGKLDRQSLPLPQSSVSSTVEFSTPMQILLGKLWCEVLGRDQVGLTDNFFDLGGHSLLATQLIARIIEATGAAVTLRALFEAPTIDLFAALLAQTQAQSYPLHRPALMAQQRPPFLNHHRSEE